MENVNLGSFLFGNVNSQGLLDFDEDIDDFMDEEIQSALSNIGKNSNASFELKIEVNPKSSTFLAQKGSKLRFSNLLHTETVYNKDRYRIRKMKLRSRKVPKVIALKESTSESFRSKRLFSVSNSTTSFWLKHFAKGIYYSDNVNSRSSDFSSRRIDCVYERQFIPTKKGDITLLNSRLFSPSVHSFNVYSWEDDIIWSLTPSSKTSKNVFTPIYANSKGVLPTSTKGSGVNSINLRNSSSSIGHSRSQTPISSPPPPPSKSLAGRIMNNSFAEGSWDEEIIFDDSDIPARIPGQHFCLDMNDPFLIMEPIIDSTARKNFNYKKGKKPLKFDQPIKDKFNFSSDRYYSGPSTHTPKEGSDASKTKTHFISNNRQTIKNSIPAINLTLPFYRTTLTKEECREWHRPTLCFSPLDKEVGFSKLIGKKLGINKKSLNSFTTPKKLSLRTVDPNEFVIIEYVEENPLLLSNVGMSNLLIHYYRKQQQRDHPSLEFSYGACRLLEQEEESSFGMFGDCAPGKVVSSIQNSLFKAPIFEHQSTATDFLAVCHHSKGKSQTSFFLRKLPQKILLAGQTMPNVEIFDPNSRNFNIFCRKRIQAFAYRLFKKDQQLTRGTPSSSQPKLRISKLFAAFPQFHDSNIRKWLKDYAESVRIGTDTSTWFLKADAPVLDEEDIQSLMTPENLCIYESMLVGQQVMNDRMMALGEKLDREVLKALSPWSMTSTFLSAADGKTMLRTEGLGDISGKNESLVMVSSSNPLFKDTTPVGDKIKRSRALEQSLYKNELVKIWKKQMKSLESDALLYAEAIPFSTQHARPISSIRKLYITRKVKSRSGKIEEVEEVIEDDEVIASYLERRKQFNRQRRKRQLELLALNSSRAAKRSKVGLVEKRAQSQPEHQVGDHQMSYLQGQQQPQQQPKNKSKAKISITCGTCGTVGHMRTNRICPLYYEYENEVAANPILADALQHSEHTMTDKHVPSLRLKLTVGQGAKNTPVIKFNDETPSNQNVLNSLNDLFTSSLERIVLSSPDSWPFKKAVNKTDYPHYYTLIAEPMDFGTISKRLKRRFYRSLKAFLDDVHLVRDNCISFNFSDHPFSTNVSLLVRSLEEDLLKVSDYISSLESSLIPIPLE